MPSQPLEEFETPFVKGDSFAYEPARITRQAVAEESPFQRTFGQGRVIPDEAEEFDSEIIGSNDMTWVNNPLAAPHRWICRLDIEYEIKPFQGSGKLKGHGIGTGTLIGMRHVLTAAHNLREYDPTQKNYLQAVRILVTPAHDGSKSPPVAGEEADLSISHVHPLYDISKRVDANGAPIPAGEVATNQYDYALLNLKTPLGGRQVKALGGPLGCWEENGSGGIAQFRRLDPKILQDNDIFVAGYGSDACVKAVPVAAGNTIPLGSQLKAQGRIMLVLEKPGSVKYASRGMAHNADTCGGQSGGPVWIERDKVFDLVGIHTAGVSLTNGSRMNYAVRVTKELVSQVRKWQAAG